MKYFDIHGHVNFAAYDADREEVIKRAQDAGVSMITVGTRIDTSRRAVKLAESHEGMYAAVGLHPIHTSQSRHDIQELGQGGREFTSRGEQFDFETYKMLASHPKVVAIGECGLDYYRLDQESIAKQRVVFENMIDLANEVDKPLMLHIRNGSNRSAYKEAYEIIKSKAKVLGNLHFFAGSIEEAKLFLDMGFSFSFTGVITFTRNYDEIIKYLPIENIMSETDCPYITPIPYRGERNEPIYVIKVVRTIAKARGESESMIIEQLFDNAKRFFKI